MAQPHVLILGTGIAGLSTALKFARHNIDVTIICKTDRADGATRWAQGGIASVWSKQDSIAEHKQDTILAGAGLCNQAIVDICVTEGPERVRELIELGVEFTRSNGAHTDAELAADLTIDLTEAYDLHREGGHGKRRILHADDLTGWAIERALLEQIDRHPNIRVLEDHIGIDLITEGKMLGDPSQQGRCVGAYVLNTRTGEVLTLSAHVTVLATGGAGKVYLFTSNPDTATGDGIAMAYRAGALVSNLEFMQFHPTCLYHPGAPTFLITEALRGEGAVLRNLAGEEFMRQHHAMGSLAPRDIVARAIDIELKRTGDKHVWLDLQPIRDRGIDIRAKFPNIYTKCLSLGLDIAQGSVPVVPAAHYTCGGVQADVNAQTSIDALYAIGEVACTGLHGANRLASNSLLEAVVFAHRAVEHALPRLLQSHDEAAHEFPPRLPEWDTGHAVELEEQIDIAANWLEIRSLMWNYVGIVRSNRRLERAKRRLDMLRAEVNAYYWDYLLTKDLVELRNLLTVADLIVQCALLRHESRGLHYTVDYPETNHAEFDHDTVL